MSIIKWLEEWYESNCDDLWEHAYGVIIDTLDNPGWRLRFDIIETPYEHIVFDDVIIKRTDTDWIHCRKKDGYIDCGGGPKNLEEMLELVKKWMDDNKPR